MMVSKNKCKFVILHFGVVLLLGYLLYYGWLMTIIATDPSKKMLMIVVSAIAAVAVVMIVVALVMWVYEYFINNKTLVRVFAHRKRRCRQKEEITFASTAFEITLTQA